MTSHIRLCLDEIDFEIDALAETAMPPAERRVLRAHVDAMRAMLAAVSEAAKPVASAPAGDDLTLVLGIDAGVARQLADLGITRFSDLAGLTAERIKGLDADGVPALRISAEGWIEQAAILASGGTTRYAAEACGTATPVASIWDTAPATASAAAKDTADVAAASSDNVIAFPKAPDAADRGLATAADGAADVIATATATRPVARFARLRLRVAASLAVAAAIGALQFIKLPAFASIAAVVASL